jgi:hypothetical protein
VVKEQLVLRHSSYVMEEDSSKHKRNMFFYKLWCPSAPPTKMYDKIRQCLKFPTWLPCLVSQICEHSCARLLKRGPEG